MKSKWTILFCAECHEPKTPAELENYNGNYLCDQCDNDDVLSQQPECDNYHLS